MFGPMTAPGNDILLTLLLIVFAGSSGYAGGRIHQWYRTSLDRDQAYRDGYDTATRSLFSLAARIIRPRRSEKAAVRGTATVTSILSAPGAAGHDAAHGAAAHGAAAHGAAAHGAAAHGAAAGAAGRATLGVAANAASHGATGHATHGAAAQGVVSGVAGHAAGSGAAARRPMPAPAAPTAAPGLRSVPRRSAEAETASDDVRPASVSQGRHTVPDELVHAATYRLSPDRIARAKVPPKNVAEDATRKPRAS